MGRVSRWRVSEPRWHHASQHADRSNQGNCQKNKPKGFASQNGAVTKMMLPAAAAPRSFASAAIFGSAFWVIHARLAGAMLIFESIVQTGLGASHANT